MAERQVVALLVHYRSGGMLLDAVADLYAQADTPLAVHVVECGDDGTVTAARDAFPHLVVQDPGANLGYCGGNNFGLARLPADVDVLIVNPDVRLPDVHTVRELRRSLRLDDRLGAVAPLIRTHTGQVEYLDSVVDESRAEAHHTQTHLEALPPQPEDVRRLPWVNGACWLLRAEALAQVGHLDERFFLFFEEVDWGMRAGQLGWDLGLMTTVEVVHTRSASFGTSNKGSYYYWRNRRLLFAKHHGDRRDWRRVWRREWARFVLRPRNLRSGASGNALLGGVDGLRGRTGPRPLRP